MRAQRVASLLRRILGELLAYEVRDPRVHLATLTDVEVTADLREARVYVMLPDDDDERREALAGLERAKGFLRREIGRQARLRVTPELHFRVDTSYEYGQQIEARLRELGLGEGEGEGEDEDEGEGDSS